MKPQIIKYAIDELTNRAVFVDNALRQFYKCFECGLILIPVMGEAKKREWHFRHQIDSNCSGGIETAIHKAAKQIILDNSRIAIHKGVIDYSEPKQERRFEKITPDVTVFSNDRNVFFEIEVTNPVEKEKEQFYIGNQQLSIKIDLSDISYDIDLAKLETLVLKSAKRSKIFWDAPKNNAKDVKEQISWWDSVTQFCIDNPWKTLLIGFAIFWLGRRFWRALTK